MKKINVLLTGAGGAGPIAIIKSLMGKYRIIGIDMNKYAVGLYLADRSYVSPPARSSAYLKLLERIVKQDKVDVIVPGIDEELIPISRYFKVKKDILIILPREQFIELCLDKFGLMKKLEEEGISSPKTFLLADFDNLNKIHFPCIVKPRVGRGSRGFAKIVNEDQLKNYLRDSYYKREGLIIQELLEGMEFTVSTVVSKKGRILSVIPKEIIKKEGITHIAVTRKNKDIEDLAFCIQKKFQANGPFNIQLIVSKKNNIPTVFEINPRLSTTAALNIAAGVNEVDLLISDYLSLPYKKPKFKNNLVMSRYFEQYYLDESQIK